MRLYEFRLVVVRLDAAPDGTDDNLQRLQFLGPDGRRRLCGGTNPLAINSTANLAVVNSYICPSDFPQASKISASGNYVFADFLCRVDRHV